MRKSKKIMSLLLTMVMTLAVLIPTLVKAAPQAEHKTKVIVHKILMKDKKSLDDHTDADKDPKYDGNEIKNISGYFGDGAVEIPNVAFDIYKEDPQGDIDFNNPVLGGKGENGKKYKLVKDNLMSKLGGIDYVLEDGTYIIVEDKEASTYKGEHGELLAATKAIPTKITLPMTLPDGSGVFSEQKPLHLYPKNTQEIPTIEKKFEDNSDRKTEMIGKEIPYKVTTVVKAGTEYKTLRWTDKMVKGLDFVTDSIVVKYNDGAEKTLDKSNYNLTQSKRGFTLSLKDSGLKLVQKAERDVTITLTYKGILNETAIVDTDIPNEIKLDYGNNPSVDSTPKEGNPKEGKIVLKKTWDLGIPENEQVQATFEVYEAETGKLVATVTLDKNNGWTQTISQDLERKPLDNNKKYIVIEKEIKGFTPEYQDEFGTIKNKKNPNPDSIVPTPPNVKTYGKKFIKTDNKELVDSKKLSGAEFVIINKNDGPDNGKFLALKPNGVVEQDTAAYKAAEEKYQNAIKRANEILAIEEGKRTPAQTEELKKLQGIETEPTSIKALKKVRDEKFEALNMQWTWVSQEDKAFKFVSQEDGTFEVKGLNKGKYDLKETKAPAGYVLPSDPIIAKDFQVGDGTYAQPALQLKNVKISIPQTGGMGAIIVVLCGIVFVGVGLAIKKKINA